MARLAGRFVALRAWESLGYARLGDFAVERLGLSARSLQDLARVDAALTRLPVLAAALETGVLTWTKVRLIARVAEPEDVGAWVAAGCRMTATALAREVRSLDLVALARAGPDPGDEDGAMEDLREAVAVECPPGTRGQWARAQWLARRVAGEALPIWECMEAVAAEVASALPIAPSLASEVSGAPESGEDYEPAASSQRAGAATGHADLPGGEASRCVPHARSSQCCAEVRELIRGLEDATPLDLDARLRRVVSMEQRIESEIAPLLIQIARTRSYRDLGCRSLEEYARERLGISPRKARMLLRLARAGEGAPALWRAWRQGQLSWVQAHALVAVLALAPGRAQAWIDWSSRTTVRRLEETVAAAVLLAEEDPIAFEQCGGLPADASDSSSPVGRHTGARPRRSAVNTSSLRWLAPRPAAVFFRAVLCTVQRRLGVPAGRALALMLEHAISSWSLREGRLRAAHRVFERDGWRCTVPGCRSYRNLHDHHIVFRSAGGGDELANRVTLCVWHHLRGVHGTGVHGSGVHGRRLRVSGRAPDELVYALPTGSWSAAEIALSPTHAE